MVTTDDRRVTPPSIDGPASEPAGDVRPSASILGTVERDHVAPVRRVRTARPVRGGGRGEGRDPSFTKGPVWISGTSKPRSRPTTPPAVRRACPGQIDLVLRAGGSQLGRQCGSVVSANAVIAEAPRTAPSRHAGCQAPPDAYRSPLRWRRPSAHVLAIAKGSRSRANRSSPVVLGLTGRRGRLELLPTGRTRDLGSA